MGWPRLLPPVAQVWLVLSVELGAWSTQVILLCRCVECEALGGPWWLPPRSQRKVWEARQSCAAGSGPLRGCYVVETPERERQGEL